MLRCRDDETRDAFPKSLVNVTDLRVTRVALGDDWGDDGAEMTILRGEPAVVSRTSDIFKTTDGREVALLAIVVIRHPSDAVDEADRVRVGDRAYWTDSYGRVSDEEVVSVEPSVVGVNRLGVRLRIGRRF